MFSTVSCSTPSYTPSFSGAETAGSIAYSAPTPSFFSGAETAGSIASSSSSSSLNVMA